MTRKLTEKAKADIREGFRARGGAGLPEEHLVKLLADHAIGLLELEADVTASWYEPAPGPWALWNTSSKCWMSEKDGHFGTWEPTRFANLADARAAAATYGDHLQPYKLCRTSWTFPWLLVACPTCGAPSNDLGKAYCHDGNGLTVMHTAVHEARARAYDERYPIPKP